MKNTLKFKDYGIDRYIPTLGNILLHLQVFVGCESVMANGCVLGPVGTSQVGGTVPCN